MTFSGEHGDGRIRSHFLEEYFGPMDANLRYGVDYKKPDFPTEYKFREDDSFAAAVEMCTGVGACRENLVGLMCPFYRATRDEEHSTRGRANALRLAMTGQMGAEGLSSPQLFEIMDLCLSCKGCKSECPSNVDVAKLKGEFLQKYRGKTLNFTQTALNFDHSILFTRKGMLKSDGKLLYSRLI